MDRSEFVARLVAGDAAERATLLGRHAAMVDADLAWSLKARYDDARTKDPAVAAAAAAALVALGQVCEDAVVGALAVWTAGRAKLQIDGQPSQALILLDQAVSAFEALDRPEMAATVQVTRLHALALLGQYDEAISCGLRARDVLLARDEPLTAGTIEQNLGNIYHRRDQYAEAERFLRLARERFDAVADQRQLAQIDNCIAIELMFQHRFRAATSIYDQALARAEQAGLELTQAEIEVNLGNLALLQGRYDRALDYLERARRRYAALGMAHELATVELELADAYLELNLISEASALYARIIPIFRTLEMQAELAHALAHQGWATALLGQPDEAFDLLAEANGLYIAEENLVGAAITALFDAQIHYSNGEYPSARASAIRAEAPLATAQAWGALLFARWLRGDVARALGKHAEAARLLETTLAQAEHYVAPQVVYRCQTSLGLLAVARGDTIGAEAAFEQAVTLLEDLRAPLPAEEFRTAFVADKLIPYAELVRLCLTGTRDRVVEALTYVERARSRALVDMLGGALPTRPKPRDAFEADLLAQLVDLREQLNWLYSQISQPPERDQAEHLALMVDLQAAVREREVDVMEINRHLRQRSTATSGALRQAVSADDIMRLQHDLGADTALVEYFAFDGEFMAFIVDDAGVGVVRGLGSEEAIEALVETLRDQTETLRYGEERMLAHLDQLSQRVRHYLRALYDALLRPLEARLGDRRLVVVPYRALHYVPFHALFDGTSYVIERREVSYAPSASVLRHCLSRPQRPLRRALLFGVADQQTPRVRDEIAALAPLFPDSLSFLNEQATRAALVEHAPRADVLHLACHGQFRPDNPLFSSLRLGDGWLTVYDAYALEIDCGLVTLSACETGVSAIAPGDELIGLARGFFSTGTPSLLVSLWTADDESTAALMRAFYTRLRAGDRPAAALRFAQCSLLERQPHPFFWSPFVLLGRW
jgi:CHAT domain-containing protein